MRRAGAGLLVALVLSTVSGCQSRSGNDPLGGVEVSLDRIEHQVDADADGTG